MTERRAAAEQAHQFIRDHIRSVPHLEALMLLWNSRPVGWTSEDLASRLYVPVSDVESLLRDLVRLKLVAEFPGAERRYGYDSKVLQQDELMDEVDKAYRKDIVGISRMIHSRASSSVREFARAFRFKKERD